MQFFRYLPSFSLEIVIQSYYIAMIISNAFYVNATWKCIKVYSIEILLFCVGVYVRYVCVLSEGWVKASTILNYNTTITEQTSLPRLINMYVLLVTFLLALCMYTVMHHVSIHKTTDNDNNNIIMDGCMSCTNKIILFKLGLGISITRTMISRSFLSSVSW